LARHRIHRLLDGWTRFTGQSPQILKSGRGVQETSRRGLVSGQRRCLKDERAELGVTPTELSRQISVPPARVTQIIHGRRGVTGDTALRLGHWFGTSAQFWLNLQNAYDIRFAELAEDNKRVLQ
jgi:addiction module HigA family antidote